MSLNETVYEIYLNKVNEFCLTIYGLYEGWNFNSGNYLFTTDTK